MVSTRRAAALGGVLRPTIANDFTTGVLDPRITFTRAAGPATVWNVSGLIASVGTNVARFDYDPVTLAAKGLLIEEARTNLWTYSEQFDHAYWTKLNTTITANATAAPDGNNTADKICSNAGGTVERYIRQATAFTSGTVYTNSVFSKAAEISAFGQDSGQGYGSVSHAPPSVGTAAGAMPLGVTLKALASGWYRGTITHNINVSGSRGNTLYLHRVGNSDPITIGQGTYGWGAQEEVGAFATSYIPTTSTSATRAADYGTITGSDFAGVWNAGSGSVVVRATSPASGVRVLWQADDGTVNNRITVYTTGTTVMVDVVAGGVTQASLNLGTIAANTAFSVAMRYGANDFAASLNGGACVTDTAGSVPVVDRLRFGADSTGNHLCGAIARAPIYAKPLPDAMLRSLAA